MRTLVPVVVLEQTLERSIAGFNSLADTLNQILAVVAEHGDADLRHHVDEIMASRRRLQATRVDFADLPCGDGVH